MSKNADLFAIDLKGHAEAMTSEAVPHREIAGFFVALKPRYGPDVVAAG